MIAHRLRQATGLLIIAVGVPVAVLMVALIAAAEWINRERREER
jgi:hypothetical protein